MTRAALLLTALVAATACGAPGFSPSRAPAEPEVGLAEVPDWLPPYDAGQRALLDQTPEGPVTAHADPVYPQLDHFAFVTPEPFSEVRARRAARLVEDDTRASEVLYLLAPIEAGQANWIAQYGPEPPTEPDPWVRVVQDGATRRLDWATPERAADAEIAASNRALRAGDLTGAAQRMRHACRIDPQVPALFVALARLEIAAGRDRAAAAALRYALRIDSRYFAAHLALGELLLRRGAAAPARHAIARALALYPASRRAWAAARRLGPIAERPSLPAIFLDAGPSGAVVVGSTPGRPALTYALCRAAVRYEPELRAQVLLVPSTAPYRLSAGEELFCAEAMLGAYLRERVDPDGNLAALLGLARRGLLASYVVFDVVGRHRPEWLRLASGEQLDAVTRYVELTVLPRR
jgi:tetratricopeptide (TPR) repeat protein